MTAEIPAAAAAPIIKMISKRIIHFFIKCFIFRSRSVGGVFAQSENSRLSNAAKSRS